MKTAALCLVGLCLTALCLTQRPDSADDFRSFYRGASLVGSSDGVYSHPTLFPDTHTEVAYLPYIRIPSYALLLKPLTLLPYRTARVIWEGLIVAAFAALVVLFPGPRDRLAIALCFSMPVVYTFMLGQDVAIVVLIAFAAGRLASSRNEFLAGMVAGLLAIKPTYLLPVGLVFLARSRRGTYGLVLSTAVQLAVSFLIEGWTWPMRYLALLRHPLFDLEPRRMLNVRAVTTALGLPPVVYIIASVVLMAWMWSLARRLDIREAMIVALPLGMLASPHSYVYDAVVILPLLIRTMTRDFLANIAGVVALTPLPYVALMLEKLPLLFAGSTTVVTATVIVVAHLHRTAHGYPARSAPRMTAIPAERISQPAL